MEDNSSRVVELTTFKLSSQSTINNRTAQANARNNWSQPEAPAKHARVQQTIQVGKQVSPPVRPAVRLRLNSLSEGIKTSEKWRRELKQAP